ncbi:hypothetical protein KIN20_033490 [Parelaphostrongylus tenuis]|uniref:K Homology domain-containing protein n=1 Tax=Parelaphostrongylus tenuis TaxID=148309 RepID=A0AAD5WIX3_PARTN|nr:hypothetical protein KIN20_033490 [Parelaphostrongylus tenuis]
MMPRFADGDQTEHTEVLQHITTSDNSAGHADRLLQEFVMLELTESPAAKLAKTTSDGAWTEFIRKTFDDNPIFEQLTKCVVAERLGATMQRNTINQHEDFYEFTIPAEEDEEDRILHLVNEVLESRIIPSEIVCAQMKQRQSMRAESAHNVLQQEVKPKIAGLGENCENKTDTGVAMSVKVYIPAPPPEVKCSYIGRIIGPMGMTIRRLELETKCRIYIRGTEKDKHRKPLSETSCGPELDYHKEDTHVLIEAESPTHTDCLSLIEQAVNRISGMFTTKYDELKREQLIQVAVLNGTYTRRNVPHSYRPEMIAASLCQKTRQISDILLDESQKRK